MTIFPGASYPQQLPAAARAVAGANSKTPEAETLFFQMLRPMLIPLGQTFDIAKIGLTMLLGLRTAIYPAPDLQRAKQWYAEVLGQQPYFDQPFYVGFVVGGFELGLIPDGEPGTQGPQPLWGVSDIVAVHARLLALGAVDLDPVKDVGEGIHVAAVRDPFGNRLSLIQNPHFDPTGVR